MSPLVLTWEGVLSNTQLDDAEARRQLAAGTFPPPRQLTRKIIGWLASEIEEWLRARQQEAEEACSDETDLYRHFDAAGRLLYVGVSLSAIGRLRAHMGSAHWSREIATVTIERLPTRAEALEAEKTAIRGERPLHNITYANRE